MRKKVWPILMLCQILEPNNYSKSALEIYERLGVVKLGEPDNYEKAVVELLVVRLEHTIDARFLQDYESLKYIVTPTTGLTHLDMHYCQNFDITVFSLKDCKEKLSRISSTSELTFGLIISLLRYIPQAHHNVVVDGVWNRDAFRGKQLAGKVLGIIGLGRIGTHIANYGNVFGMQVIAVDDGQSDAHFVAHKVKRVSQDELLGTSDIVTVHADFCEHRKQILNAEAIKRIKIGSCVVNTARGQLVDEVALDAALRSGQIAGVAVDVLQAEHSNNLITSSPLLDAATDGFNVLITPHIGGCSIDAMQQTEDILAQHVFSRLGTN